MQNDQMKKLTAGVQDAAIPFALDFFVLEVYKFSEVRRNLP
jgi:hypothetical protein